MSITKIYHNQKQILKLKVQANTEYVIGGRGSGKSEGVDAPNVLRNVFEMPQSTGVLLSPTYGKLLQNTLPAVNHALARWGYHKDLHYVVGKIPPKQFKRPFIEPLEWKNCITWFNGTVFIMVSFDRPMSVNSMSINHVLGFEARYLNYEKIKTEVLPAVRTDNAKRNYWKNCPWISSQSYTSDRPITSQGKWLLEKKQFMNNDLIETIVQTYELYKHYKSTAKHYRDERYAKLLFKDLQDLRKIAVHYMEMSALDNIEILGEDYINKMKRDLPALVFQTSILNLDIRKIPNGFYAAIDANLHLYTDLVRNDVIDQYDINSNIPKDCRFDADIDENQPLEIAADYNAAINNIVVAQFQKSNKSDSKGVMKTVNQFWVKTPQKLKDVAIKFAKYYEPRQNRDVIYYYDSTAVAESALSDTTFADEIIGTLKKYGFKVKPVYFGQPQLHKVKHIQIDNALKADPRYLYIKLNETKCEDLFIAMEITGVKVGKNGFEKDKSLERKPDSTENPDEHKTHATDAWDTLFEGMNFHRPNAISDLSIESIYLSR